MSTFEPRWTRWTSTGAEPTTVEKNTSETSSHHTAETDESAFGSFGSAQDGRSETVFRSSRRQRASSTPGSIAEMSLDDFATAGLVVTVHSAALGRRVLLVSDDVPEERIGHPGLPVFRASELKKLAALRPPPASLRTLAEVKAVFRADNPILEEATHE